MNGPSYAGTELELFAGAINWKTYSLGWLSSHVSGRVLDVGAGIGTSALMLAAGRSTHWTCLELDPALAESAQASLASKLPPERYSVLVGTTGSLPSGSSFNTVLYVDVLEHVLEDREELQRAANLLLPHGALIVLAPAHSWLYSPFDAAIGHYRRYTRASLQALTPAGTHLCSYAYLDSVGLFASLANKWIMRQSTPLPSQIAFWDRYMVPMSRWVDRIFGFRVGKTVIMIWHKD